LKLLQELYLSIANIIVIADDVKTSNSIRPFGAYNFLPTMKCQVCWAHLKRDLTKISEHSGIAEIIGYKLLRTYN